MLKIQSVVLNTILLFDYLLPLICNESQSRDILPHLAIRWPFWLKAAQLLFNTKYIYLKAHFYY